MLNGNYAFLDRKLIQLQFENLKTTGSSINRKWSRRSKGYYPLKSGKNTARHDSIGLFVGLQKPKTWARWNNHCHLPMFTCTTEVTV